MAILLELLDSVTPNNPQSSFPWPQVPTVAQNSGGHGHTPSPAVHGGAHHHSPAVQSHGPSVMSGHGHTAAPQASAQGQQQFQRLKVSLHTFSDLFFLV